MHANEPPTDPKIDARNTLKDQTKEHLVILAKKLRVRHARKLPKDELIEQILLLPGATIRQALHISWWDKWHNHVYGIGGVAATVIFGWWFFHQGPNAKEQKEILAKQDQTLEAVRRNAATNAVPDLPEIAFTTSDTWPLEDTSGSSEERKNLRLHQLTIRNRSDADIRDFIGILQFPEPIISYRVVRQTSVGAKLTFHPNVTGSRVYLSGGGTNGEGAGFTKEGSHMSLSVSQPGSVAGISVPPPLNSSNPRPVRQMIKFGAPSATGVWELGLELPAMGEVQIDFVASNGSAAASYFKLIQPEALRKRPIQPTQGSDELFFYLEGKFQYQGDGRVKSRGFFVPLVFDWETRKITSLPTQDSSGTWKPVTLRFGY